MEVISNSSRIINPHSSSLATQSPSHQQELSIGISDSKVTISRQYNTQGGQNPSDYLSRHAIHGEERQRSLAEEYVYFLAANAVPKAMTLDEIRFATKQDKTLQCVSWLVRSQQWHKIDNLPTEHQEANQAELKMFRKVKEDLTVSDESDIVLKNSCIVVPTVLREKAITLAHEGHQGLVKTKQLLREKV